MVSIAVHLVVLMLFGVVKVSQSKTSVEGVPPAAMMSRIRQITESAPLIPKPKMKRVVRAAISDRFTNRPKELLPVSRIFRAGKPGLQDWPSLVNNSVTQGRVSVGGVNLPEGVEFFGSFTDRRKVCYVVDCSGSMRGMFGRVRKELADSIRGLQPDYYFYIIFFGGGKLMEFGDGRLLRATERSKSAACVFIESVEPAGQTNALAALERAVQIRDDSEKSPSIIYFLTDGFELTTNKAAVFPQRTANLLMRFAPMTKINTIGFWSQSEDREMLRAIAGLSGGECVFIGDG
jgi:hypothetical protein